MIAKKLRELNTKAGALAFRNNGRLHEAWWDYFDEMYHLQSQDWPTARHFEYQYFGAIEELEIAMRKIQPDLCRWKYDV